MRKYTLLLALLFAVTSFAQVVRTESIITGLGQFRFGMSRDEVKKSMQSHITNETDISLKANGSVILMNVTCNGYTFNACFLHFNERGLYSISFIKMFDHDDNSITNSAKMLVDLKNVFGEQYGELTVKNHEFDENNTLSYAWFDKYDSNLMLMMSIDEKETTLSMSVLQEEEPVPVQKPASTSPSLGLGTSVPVTGFGEFALGMSPDKLEEVIDGYKSSNSKFSGILDGESIVGATNLRLLGYVFNDCSFRFIEGELSHITLEMYFDKRNKAPYEFDELLSMIESDYGEQSKKLSSPYAWQSEDKRLIMLAKHTDKKQTTIRITVTKDITDLRNLIVYER